MYTPEMLESIARVEAHRAQNLATEPRRMTAEEKEALLKAYHPDYREDQFTSLQVGQTPGRRRLWSWRSCSSPAPGSWERRCSWTGRIWLPTYWSLAAAERAVRQPWRPKTPALLCC